MKGHEGKTALVTGASQGLGKAFAERLAVEGVDVACVDLKTCAETIAAVETAGRRAIGYECDIASPEAVSKMAAAVDSDFGGVDILVNNASIYPRQSLEEISWEDWRRVLSVNLDGTFLLCKAFVPGMRERGNGRIVNVVTAVLHLVAPSLIAYTASKGGVQGLTRALATELGNDGITVNAIGPSLIATPGVTEDHRPPGSISVEDELEALAQMQAIKRTEVPEDLCGALAFLTSDEAAFVTGQTFFVDGGLVRT